MAYKSTKYDTGHLRGSEVYAFGADGKRIDVSAVTVKPAALKELTAKQAAHQASKGVVMVDWIKKAWRVVRAGVAVIDAAIAVFVAITGVREALA